MKKMLLVDGNSLLFRAYYATAYGSIMRSKDGTPTNALFALANMLNKVIDNVNPDYALIAFDTDKKTFRHEEYKDYKAGRKPAPDDLVVQFPLAREMVSKMGLKCFELAGYEADDIVATMAKIGEANDCKVEIFSSDRDLFQLISDKVTVNVPKKGTSDILAVTPKVCKEEYGLLPSQVTDYKGIFGDTSDNIKGIKGIGEKGALKLLEEYGSMEGIYENIDNITGKLKEKLIEGKEDGFYSKKLATIYSDVPLGFSIEDIAYTGIKDSLIEFYQRYDMISLIKKISFNNKEKFDYEEVEIINDSFLKQDLGVYLFFKETNYHFSELEGISFSNEEKTYYVKKDNLFKSSNIKSYLENEEYKKSCYDIKASIVMLNRLGINPKGFDFDFKIACYLLDSSMKDDIYAVFNTIGVILPDIKDDNNIGEFASLVAFNSYKLKEELIAKMKEKEVYSLFVNMEMPLVYTLVDMENNGVKVDKGILEDLGVEFRFKLNMLESDIYRLANKKFNIASPKQVGEVLFDDLGLKSNKKRSTSSEELMKLVHEHEIVEYILQYRKYAKLLSTYVDSLGNFVCEDGKIHAIFNQALTQTGRLSSSEPNMQNISVRDEESKSIRKAFLPSNDYILSIDYSQVELRVLASLAGDETMIKYFEGGEDVHLMTASAIFDMPKEMVTDSMRRQAKAVNFGIVYGISDWGLSEQIGCTPSEAKKFITKYFETFPKIKEYLDVLVAECKEKGYVTTILGRRREVKEINSSSYMEREFGKRVAMNTPIQGSAADIIKVAMININNYLKENNYKSKMIMQIHDELVFDVVESEKEFLVPTLTKMMEEASNLTVRLKAESGIGKDWFSAK